MKKFGWTAAVLAVLQIVQEEWLTLLVLTAALVAFIWWLLNGVAERGQ